MSVSRLARFYYLKCLRYFRIAEDEGIDPVSVVKLIFALCAFGVLGAFNGMAFYGELEAYFWLGVSFASYFLVYLLPFRLLLLMQFCWVLFFIFYSELILFVMGLVY